MMFGLRVSVAATRLPSIARTATNASRPASGTGLRALMAARNLSVCLPRFKKDVIQENNIPMVHYAPDSEGHNSNSGIHTSIPVTDEGLKDGMVAGPVAPQSNPMDTLNCLSDEVYQKMPLTMKNMTVKGKVIIITGAARGLGNYMARACAEAGAKAIIMFDANSDLGDTSAAELHQKTGLPVTFLEVDVRDERAIFAAVDKAVDLHGTPDVLVNSAGIADSNLPAETYDADMFRRLMDVNLNGSFFTSQAVGRAMIRAGKTGSIVLVASMSGSIVNYPQEQSCYNASKAGVIQLGRSLAAEWAKYNIRVNCISPGYMDTALNKVPALDAQKKIWTSRTPQGRLGNVDELNGLCIFLASDASSFMTGANCIIDGGYTLY